MAGQAFQSLDFRHLPGRILAVGDVHGRFDLLEKRLAELSYNPTLDRLVFLGDLINRGPYSHHVVNWWHELRVIGNHEQIVAWSAYNLSDRQKIKGYGSWFDSISESEKQKFADRLMDAPVAIEIKTPSGRTVGFVHAQVPSFPRHDWKRLAEMMKNHQDPFHHKAIKHAQSMRYDWAIARHVLSNDRHPDHDNACEQSLWGRSQSILVKSQKPTPWVDGIDHVFFGHSKLPEPVTQHNCSWIDTGAYETENLTVIDVDKWISEKNNI